MQTTSPKSRSSATAASGVNYKPLDMWKRYSQECASRTNGNADRLGLRFLPWSRGESAALFEILPNFRAKRVGFVHEGLGTKNLIADAFRKEGRRSFYDTSARDTLAMVLNDASTLATAPAAVSMHLSVGHSDWFNDVERYTALAEGWADACNEAGVVWACGETPELQNLLLPDAAELSGATWGPVIGNMDPRRLEDRLAMVFFEGTGLHANGATGARNLAKTLPDGYETIIDGGQTYGEALLQPTPLYCRAVEALLRSGIDLHYGVGVTGHGLMKLMRADVETPLAYVVSELPKPQPIFTFMQRHKGTDDRGAYGSWNMNVGYAVYLPKNQAAEACRIVNGEFPYRAFVGGEIRASDAKRVIVEPTGVTYEADELEVR